MIRTLAWCPLTLAISAMGSQAVAEDDFTLEEIVVTAQKRAQSLQDVPISVSAVGGEKLAEAGIENLQDLSAYVPNLKIVEGGLVPQMYIRGIGSGSNQGFEQSVGTYSDGVYMGRSLQSRSSFMDLERVEVLRGPQSILFGQSSIAGAISLVSAKPTDEFEAMVSASHAPEYGETEINAYVSGSITDTFRARLAIRDRQEDGYLENPLLDKDGPNVDEQTARLILDWDLSENLNAELKLESARVDRKDGRQGQVVDLGDYPLLVPGLQDTAELDLKQFSTNANNTMSFDSDTALLKLEYAFDSGLTLISLTAHSEYDYDEPHYDGESSEVNIVDMDMSESFEQFSQEIRLTSPGGETVDYIVGAFYQDSEQKYNEDARLTVSSLGLPTPLDSFVKRPFSQDAETWAVFAQATWNISEEFRMTLGLRYTEDEKSGSRDQTTYSINHPGVLQSNVSIVNGLPCDAGGTCVVPGHLVSTTLGGGFNLIDHNLKGDNSKSNWTPSINVQYDLTTDIMLYATYTEGYKAGGFDARGINGATGTGAGNPFGYGPIARGGDNFEYGQEEAATFELGAKMTLLDGTAELNAAVYQTDYTDMQVSIYDGTFGFNVFNAGEATVKGIELDARWRPTQNILLTAGLAYLDFEWTEYSEAVCPGIGEATFSASGSGNCDAKGRENLQTPEWTANLSANHTLPIGDSLELRSTLDANFKDNHYTSNDLDDRGEQSAATLYNMRFALASTDETWQLALVGKNLTDKRIMNYNVSLTQGAAAGTDTDGNGVADGGRNAQINRPRTLAIEGTYRF